MPVILLSSNQQPFLAYVWGLDTSVVSVERSNLQDDHLDTSRVFVLRAHTRHDGDEWECLVAIWDQVEVSRCALSKSKSLFDN